MDPSIRWHSFSAPGIDAVPIAYSNIENERNLTSDFGIYVPALLIQSAYDNITAILVPEQEHALDGLEMALRMPLFHSLGVPV